MTVQQAFQNAIEHHQAGRLRQAEALYRQIHAQHPTPEVCNNLGQALQAMGRLDEAAAAYQEAVTRRPDFAPAYFGLGTVLFSLGKFAQAANSLRRLLELAPDSPEGHNAFGNALTMTGRHDEAIAAYQKAILLNPSFADPYNNLASALLELGRHEEAIAVYQRALALRPTYPEAHYNLGDALKQTGRLDEAIAEYRAALALRPEFPEALSQLGATLHTQGKFGEAENAFHQSLQQKPDFVAALNNLGNTLVAVGRLDEAAAAYRRAIAIDPRVPEAFNNLGIVLLDMRDFAGSIAASQSAIALRPGYAEAIYGLSKAQRELGLMREALAGFRRATILSVEPRFGSTLVYHLHFRTDTTPVEIYDEHVRWNQKYAKNLQRSVAKRANDRSPGRRLRIGYASPDFRRHSVSYFVEPILASHDREQFEIFCYADVTRPDATTARFQALADHWRDISGLSAQRIADWVRTDQIDILVDLAGHTSGLLPSVFALKPAPVQVTQIGYPGTTGLTTIDYRITDAFADPPGDADALYTERLWRLAGTAWCYRPPSYAPDVSAGPGESAEHFTFGCFNHLAKINDLMLDLWSQILRASPHSRLVLKAAGLNDERTRARILAKLTANGADSGRIDLLPQTDSPVEHLSSYSRMDAALDTFPYSGTTTTCEALWMGVPVITIAGAAHVSRVSGSLLTAIGLNQFVAANRDEYVQIAVQMAQEPSVVAQLRREMRDRLIRSPIRDEAGHARRLEDAYRTMWKAWCGGG